MFPIHNNVRQNEQWIYHPYYGVFKIHEMKIEYRFNEGFVPTCRGENTCWIRPKGDMYVGTEIECRMFEEQDKFNKLIDNLSFTRIV